jgi:hypothetical protein
LALGHFAERVAEECAVDDAARERLGEHRLIAEDPEIDLVALGDKTPIIERRHGGDRT